MKSRADRYEQEAVEFRKRLVEVMNAAVDERVSPPFLPLALDVPSLNRAASFHCVLVALEHAEDPAPLIASGAWAGEIARAPRGRGGFGYDPVFFDRTLGRTAAELEPGTKNHVSHRGTALRALVELLKNR